MKKSVMFTSISYERILIMLKLALIFFLLLGSVSFAQYIKVENGLFRVVNYTLPEDILIYRIYDVNNGICVRGGEMDYFDFYEWNYFTDKPGKYEIVIYIKPNRFFIREKVEVK